MTVLSYFSYSSGLLTNVSSFFSFWSLSRRTWYWNKTESQRTLPDVLETESQQLRPNECNKKIAKSSY